MKLLALILLIVHVTYCVNVTTNDQKKDDPQHQQTRRERLLKFEFGNAGFGKNEKELMRNRLTNIITKIAELERVRAKVSSIEELQNVFHFLKDVCPPNTNSFRVGKKCYEHVTNLWMDYDSAFIYCNSRGGALAQPDFENDGYVEELREYFPSLGDNSVLVGITDMLQEGHFTFMDGTPVLTHRFYGEKFPVYADKDCVSLTKYKGFGFVDVDCRRLHEVLCEYQPDNMLRHYYY